MEVVAAAEAAGGAPSARGLRQDSLDGEGGCDGAAEASEDPASAAVGGTRAAACMQPREPPLQRPPRDMDAFCTDLNADRVTPRRPSQAMPPCLVETSACILMITRPCLTEA